MASPAKSIPTVPLRVFLSEALVFAFTAASMSAAGYLTYEHAHLAPGHFPEPMVAVVYYIPAKVLTVAKKHGTHVLRDVTDFRVAWEEDYPGVPLIVEMRTRPLASGRWNYPRVVRRGNPLYPGPDLPATYSTDVLAIMRQFVKVARIYGYSEYVETYAYEEWVHPETALRFLATRGGDEQRGHPARTSAPPRAAEGTCEP